MRQSNFTRVLHIRCDSDVRTKPSDLSQCGRAHARRLHTGGGAGGWTMGSGRGRVLHCAQLDELQDDTGVGLKRGDRRGTGIETQGSHQSSNGGDSGYGGNTALFTLLASSTILISYADRGNLASAIVPMSEQFGWSTSFEGLVLSAFFVGYATTQVSDNKPWIDRSAVYSFQEQCYRIRTFDVFFQR